MNNSPIVDGRIVNDPTFAIRLLNFLKDCKVCDQASEEEKDYLIMVAKQLLQHQINTVSAVSEIDYLDRLGLL